MSLIGNSSGGLPVHFGLNTSGSCIAYVSNAGVFTTYSDENLKDSITLKTNYSD